MTPVEPREMLARRRPGVIALVWAWKLLCAWMVAAPIGRAIAAAGASRLPDGDGVLFQPGGLLLVEAIRVGGSALAAALKGASLTAVLLGVASLLPLSVLCVALCHGGKLRAAELVGRSLEHVPAFVLLSGLTLVVQALAALVFGLVLAGLDDPLHRYLDERAHDLGLLGVAGLGIALLVLVGVAQDLGRAHAVRWRSGGWRAFRAGFALLARRPGTVLVGWLGPALWSLFALGTAELVVHALDVSQPGALRLLAVVVVHQLAALCFVAARAAWLARALSLQTTLGAPLPGDTAEASGAPGDPSPAPAA